MSGILFDHIAIATHRMAEAPAVLVGTLGGTPTGDGGPSGAYTWGTGALPAAAGWRSWSRSAPTVSCIASSPPAVPASTT